MSPNISVSLFQQSDGDAVKSLIFSIVVSELKDIPPSTYLNELGNLPWSDSGVNDEFWVAKDGDEVIGTIAFKDDDGEGMIRRFFVNPHYRSKGIGRMLVDEALQHAKKNKIKSIFFIGNTRLQKAKAAMLSFGFKLKEEISLGEMGIFKLHYQFSD